MSLYLESKHGEGRRRRHGLSTTSGAARSTWLALLATAIAVGFVGLWLMRGDESAATAARPVATPTAPEAFLENPNSVRLDAPTPPKEVDRKFPAALFDPARFEGVARLEVFLFADGEQPGAWTLSLEPSRVLMGGEHAVARHVELSADQRHVVLDDVPLGGYEVRAIAPGMECSPQFVQFSRPDELDVVLQLRLFAAGTLSGRVVDSSGAPVEEIEVRVRRNAAPSDAVNDAVDELVTTTDRRGEYAFERLLDGEYLLLVGRADAPLATRDLAFSAPGFTMPDVGLPKLGALDVRVFDPTGAPLAGADVSVIGLPSGAISGTTDSDGYAHFAKCAAGEARVVGEHPSFSAQTVAIRFDPERPELASLRLGVR